MRLFVALEIPAEVRKNLAALLDSLRAISREPKWVRPENLHVTLKFLGEVADAKISTVRTALAGIRSEEPVSLAFCGLGFFPNAKRPRVFWVGIETSANLKKLATDMEAAMEQCGIPRETREFSPHLTLARFERPNLAENLRSVIVENSQREFGKLQTNEFHLIQSRLKPSGAEYTTIARFVFAPGQA